MASMGTPAMHTSSRVQHRMIDSAMEVFAEDGAPGNIGDHRCINAVREVLQDVLEI